MKTLKFSFAAIIAILAVGLTIAAQAGVFEGKKAVLETDCFIPTTSAPFLQIKDDANCASSVVTINPNSPCSIVAINDLVWSVDELSIFTDQEVLDICQTGTRFCCLKLAVVPEAQRLCTQPLVDAGAATSKYYKVAQVFCRPQ